MVDYRFAFEMLVDRLTKDDHGFTDEQIKTIAEIAESCIEDATYSDEEQ